MTKSLRKNIQRCVLTAAALATPLLIFSTAVLLLAIPVQADDIEPEPYIEEEVVEPEPEVEAEVEDSAVPEEAAEAEDSTILEEILVTAQRREEKVQSTPLSVTALSAEMLLAGGVVDVTRLKLLTPGLNYGQTGANTHLSLRGARTEGILANVQPIISFYNDGIYRSGTLQMAAPLVDIERVEVLRGPQGTLFGRNSYGGVINVITKRPEPEFDMGISAILGNYDRMDFQGFVNIPLGIEDIPLLENMAVRFAAAKRDHDGYVENSFDRSEDIKDQDDFYFRGSGLWEPNERVSLLLRGSYWEQKGNGSADFNYYSPGTPEGDSASGKALPFNVLNSTCLADMTPCPAQKEDPYKFARDVDFILDVEQTTYSGQLDWEFDLTNVMLLAAYSDYENFHTNDIDMSDVDTGFEGQYDKLETTQVELHFTDNGSAVQWLVGGIYLGERSRDSFFIEANGAGMDGFAFNFANKRKLEMDSWAGFGQVTVPIPMTDDRLRVTGGVRFSYEKQRQDLVEFFECCTNMGTFLGPLNTSVPDFRATRFNPNKGALADAIAECDADLINCGFPIYTDHPNLRKTYSPITYRGAIDFDLFEDITLLYASVSSGYSSGGFNQVSNPITGSFSFDEQKVTAYEIGAKNTLLGGAMTFNVAVFYNDFHQILAEPNAFVGAANIIYNEVGGKGDAIGVDVELDWIPFKNALLNIRYAYLHAEYGGFRTGPGGTLSTGNTTRTQKPRTGMAGVFPFVQVRGKQIAFSPDHTLGLNAEYSLGLGAFGRLTPGVQFYYSSSYMTADQHFPFAKQDDYTQTDVRLTWHSPDEHWTISGFVQNIEEEEVLLRTNIFTGKQIGQTFADPRIYGASVAFRF